MENLAKSMMVTLIDWASYAPVQTSVMVITLLSFSIIIMALIFDIGGIASKVNPPIFEKFDVSEAHRCLIRVRKRKEMERREFIFAVKHDLLPELYERRKKQKVLEKLTEKKLPAAERNTEFFEDIDETVES